MFDAALRLLVCRREDGSDAGCRAPVPVILGLALLHPVQRERVSELRMELPPGHLGARHPGSVHHCVHRLRGWTLAVFLSR